MPAAARAILKPSAMRTLRPARPPIGIASGADQIDEPRQIARAQRVDLTLGPVDLEGLELR